MKKKTRISMAVSAVAGVLLLGAVAATASADAPGAPATSQENTKADPPPAPPAPEWVNPDGTVDESKMPDELPLIGPDGKVVRGADGKPKMVRTKVRLNDSAVPGAPAPAARAGEKRSTSTDADGRKTETVEVEPSVPPAR